MNGGFHSEHFSRSESPKTNGQGQYDQRFTLKPFDEIKLSTVPNYLIKGIIPRTGLVVIWGPPKCGKSFWTFDLMMYAALGRPYRGRRVQQGAVVYLALEGGYGFQARVEAWRRRHLADHRDPVPFYLLDVPVDLIADHQRLIAAIKAQFGSQIIPAAVVIDTLNRALIGDENKSDDMAKFIRASDMIRQAFGCVVPIVHHCGVAGGRPRGHTSLSGADDAQIAIERDKADNIIAKIEHMKDGEAGATIVSRLDRVELGDDDDGDPISSCVIVPAEARPLDRNSQGTRIWPSTCLKS
jgi:AAA domain